MGERESMVERVARAIAVAYRMDPDESWMAFERQARAAIAAMREPTDEMCWAGHKVVWGYEDMRSGRECWGAMIDAALAEQPSPSDHRGPA